MEGYGAAAAKVTEAGLAGLTGAVAFKLLPGLKKLPKAGWIGAAALAIGDLMWQSSRA